MGRCSRVLAAPFATFSGVEPGAPVLDVGSGPGALTRVLVDRVGARHVSAVDPSPSFVADCIARFPDVDVRAGRAEAIPFGDDSFDAALAQLVLPEDRRGAVREELRARVGAPAGAFTLTALARCARARVP